MSRTGQVDMLLMDEGRKRGAISHNENMEFEWDETKNPSNIAKHAISFEEAATVFGDPHALTATDIDHSDAEDRVVTFGYSNNSRLIVVIHTDRGNVIRLISARAATPSEKRNYAKT